MPYRRGNLSCKGILAIKPRNNISDTPATDSRKFLARLAETKDVDAEKSPDFALCSLSARR
jgi:hypothetical protein